MTQPPVPWAPPEATQGRAEQLVRGVSAVFLVVSFAVVALLVLRPGDAGYSIGSCLSGYWSDDADSSITLVNCTEPHDYVVSAIVDDPNECPPSTIGRMPFTTGGLIPKDRYECIRGA